MPDKDLQTVSYYYIVREKPTIKNADQYAKHPLKPKTEYYGTGRKELWKEHDILVRPVDKRDNYIKRCVAIPGDTLQIIDGVVHIMAEGKKIFRAFNMILRLQPVAGSLMKKLQNGYLLMRYSIQFRFSSLQVPLTDAMAEELNKNKLVRTFNLLFVQKIIMIT